VVFKIKGLNVVTKNKPKMHNYSIFIGLLVLVLGFVGALSACSRGPWTKTIAFPNGIPVASYTLIPHKLGDPPLLPHPIVGYQDCCGCHLSSNNEHGCKSCHLQGCVPQTPPTLMLDYIHGVPIDNSCCKCHLLP
jgi:hypothetical protein